MLGRVLGRPGAVSFRRFAALAAAARPLAESQRALGGDALRAAAQAIGETHARAGTPPVTAEYLALAREAAARTVHLTAFDEQLVAAAALMAGHAVEMDTGEGKTLSGALAAAGLALAGRQVHVLSVNDYLAARDAEWMRPLFESLGLSVATVGQASTTGQRREAYRADVVYLPVTELGFDLLRDRFVERPADAVHPVLDAVIVDEADAVMIDEAAVPLVLAGDSPQAARTMERATALVAGLHEGEHFEVDEERANVTLTDAGLDALEALLGGLNLYGAEGVPLLTELNLALHARVLVQRDVDYLVDERGAIRLIDAGRGRVARLQRWPDGLHAAVEAKEGLPVTSAGVVLDTITIHDLLRGYQTLAGMSGTVVAVADDLLEFYQLPAGRVERRVPNRRIDAPERILLSAAEKQREVVAEVRRLHAEGRPVLVGTQSVAESDALAGALRATGLAPVVLNARNDADEAAIIGAAGAFGALTISTQMSGRGTDIRLGGPDAADHDRVAALGGLAVVSTGRYPSGRLDAQLRGRAGRQGDPGSSASFVSLDDELVRTAAPPHLLARIERAGSALPAAERSEIIADCQAVAEGMRLDRHRSTWAYNRAVVKQRQAVLAVRERVLGREPAGRREQLERAIELFELDDEWQAHLALLGEVRDGIHLRALAGLVPVDEFHRIALEEFDGFFERVAARTASLVAGLTDDDLEGGLAGLGLIRPSATWTYMMSDNPLGSPGDRAVRALGQRWRRALNLE